MLLECHKWRRDDQTLRSRVMKKSYWSITNTGYVGVSSDLVLDLHAFRGILTDISLPPYKWFVTNGILNANAFS